MGCHTDRDGLRPAHSVVVCAGSDRYPLSEDIEVDDLPAMAGLLQELA